MGLMDKVNEVGSQVQEGVRSTLVSTMNLILKLFTAFVLGLFFSLIFQELFFYGTISFMLILMVIMSLSFSLIKSWNMVSVFIFDLICVLVALLLKMYLLLAP